MENFISRKPRIDHPRKNSSNAAYRSLPTPCKNKRRCDLSSNESGYSSDSKRSKYTLGSDHSFSGRENYTVESVQKDLINAREELAVKSEDLQRAEIEWDGGVYKVEMLEERLHRMNVEIKNSHLEKLNSALYEKNKALQDKMIKDTKSYESKFENLTKALAQDKINHSATIDNLISGNKRQIDQITNEYQEEIEAKDFVIESQCKVIGDLKTSEASLRKQHGSLKGDLKQYEDTNGGMFKMMKGLPFCMSNQD
ncbi:uncharacterized protein L201_002197 [Kwoniella dendrophila CBS 6074]|uniref:Uncharacterized protein n=1 Tax=Kwoniella dendrophila CBS 6074 TaxID=1295534 RepID=A0AAX4JQW9_9TREE